MIWTVYVYEAICFFFIFLFVEKSWNQRSAMASLNTPAWQIIASYWLNFWIQS